jgi:hypothetical protein
MSLRLETETASVAWEQELIQQADRVVRSGPFRGSEILRHLLTYLATRAAEGASEPVRVREIATGVFGRSDDFDSQTDSIVRVHTGRLRSKLAEYYLTEGAEDPIVISIPKGSYALAWRFRESAAKPIAEVHLAPAPVSDNHVSTPTRPRSYFSPAVLIAGALLLVALTALITWLAGRTVTRESESPAVPQALKTFWRPFVGAGDIPLVVYSNLRLVGSLDGGLREFDPKLDARQPVLDTYTTIGEVSGVFEISRLLTLLHQPLRAKHGALLTWDEARDRNLIFVGGPLAQTPLSEVPILTEFEFRNRRAGIPGPSGAILNLHPRTGESSIYFGPQKRPFDFDYAVVALRPSVNPSHRTLAVAGITEYGTQAAAEFVTREDSVRILLARLNVKPGGSLPMFEALLRTTIRGGVPIESELLAVHAR